MSQNYFDLLFIAAAAAAAAAAALFIVVLFIAFQKWAIPEEYNVSLNYMIK